MKASDDLFRLIKSLTPNEKRYFKLHAKKHLLDGKKSNYEKLYDALDKIPDENDYDETVFKKQQKGKPFIKYFADEKKNLEEIILSTMRVFQSAKEKQIQIYDEIKDIDFLINKGLHDHALKKIKLASKICDDYELFAEQLVLNYYISEIHLIYSKDVTIDITKLIESNLQNISCIQWQREYTHLLYDIKNYNKYSKSDAYDIIEKINNNKNVIGYERLESRVYNITKDILVKYEDFNSLLSFTKKRLESTKQIQSKIKKGDYFLLPYYSNILYSLLRLEDMNEYSIFLKKLSSLQFQDKSHEFERQKIYYHFELIYLLNCKDERRYENNIDDILRFFKQNKTILDNIYIINFHINVSLLHFFNKKYDLAIETISLIQKFVYTNKVKYNAATEYHLELLNIICHFNTNNIIHVEHLVRKLERKVNNENDISYQFIKTYLKIFKGIYSKNNKTDKKYKLLLSEIDVLQLPPSVQQIHGIVEEWLSN